MESPLDDSSVDMFPDELAPPPPLEDGEEEASVEEEYVGVEAAAPSDYERIQSELDRSPILWTGWVVTHNAVRVLLGFPLRSIYSRAVLKPLSRRGPDVRARVGVPEVRGFSSMVVSLVTRPLSLAVGLGVDVLSELAYSKVYEAVAETYTDRWFGVRQPPGKDVETDRGRWQFWASQAAACAVAGVVTYPLTKWWVHWATGSLPSVGAYAGGLLLGRSGFYQGLLPSLIPPLLGHLEPEVTLLALVQWLTAAESSTLSLEQMSANARRRETWSEDVRFFVHNTAVQTVSCLALTLLVAPVSSVLVHAIVRPLPESSLWLAPFRLALHIFRKEGLWGFYKAAVPLFLSNLVPIVATDLLSIFLTPIHQHLADLLLGDNHSHDLNPTETKHPEDDDPKNPSD